MQDEIKAAPSAIEQLKAEKKMLEERHHADTVRIGQLQKAIEALEGKSVRSTRSVPDMVEAVIRDMPQGAVFDALSIRSKSEKMFPLDGEKIARGVHNALHKFLRKNLIVRAPGGFKLVSP